MIRLQKVWFGRAACTKPQPFPKHADCFSIWGRASSEALPLLCTDPLFCPYYGAGKGAFYVGPESACAVRGAAAGVCGGGLPVILALLEHGVRRAGGGAERSGPPPACGAGKLLRLWRSAADGHLSALLALCFPGEGSYARLYPYTDADGQARLYRERNTSRPFLLDVAQDVSGLGVRCYAVPRRYAAAPLAEQLIGYLDSEGHGAAGLEAALDDVLYTGERDTLHCAVTAQGRLRRGSEPILEKADSAPQGVRLTLSRSIQRAAEGVAAESMATGCILIIDVSSGKVRACVSLPDFDAANVGESLTAPDSPLLNRAFSAYAVGSVFKPVLAAAALEAGEGDFTRECPGYDALNGQVYRCAGSVPHGLVGLDGALEKSCNGYFIELGRELGPERVRQMAAALGFGKGQDIAGGLRSASGVLPEAEILENEGQFANFCFGQGELLATPLQVAGMMNTIAAGGVYHTPLFMECTVDETTGEELTPLAHSSSRRVFSVQTAEKLQELLAGVVAEGTGRQAAPSEGTAAGKTGTAQTGQFRDGEELKNHWFAGFYPAEKPRWTIVVMQDAQTEPEVSSAAVFARLCDALSAGE